MTALVAAGLLILAMLDGAFSGFRSSLGRTGLIDHRATDWVAARRGAILCGLLLLPVAAGTAADVLLRPAQLGVCTRAGVAMLAVYVPYALVVLVALGCYRMLGWRTRYLASAGILGPLTLLRPAVALLGGTLAAITSRDVLTSAFAILSVAAVLAVEPVAGRRWHVSAMLLPIGIDPGCPGAPGKHGKRRQATGPLAVRVAVQPSPVCA